MIKDEKSIEISLKRGVKTGTLIPYSLNTQRNILLEIDEKPHSFYQRNGNDLIYFTNIN